MTDLFTVCEAPYVTAAGDGEQLTVARSLSCGVDDPRYRPVADYIRQHDLVLVETDTRLEPGMAGKCAVSHYATPQVRMLLLMKKEEANQ